MVTIQANKTWKGYFKQLLFKKKKRNKGEEMVNGLSVQENRDVVFLWIGKKVPQQPVLT